MKLYQIFETGELFYIAKYKSIYNPRLFKEQKYYLSRNKNIISFEYETAEDIQSEYDYFRWYIDQSVLEITSIYEIKIV